MTATGCLWKQWPRVHCRSLCPTGGLLSVSKMKRVRTRTYGAIGTQASACAANDPPATRRGNRNLGQSLSSAFGRGKDNVSPRNQPPTTQFVDKTAAGELLGVSPRTIEKWTQRREIPFIRFSHRCVRYDWRSSLNGLTPRCPSWGALS